MAKQPAVKLVPVVETALSIKLLPDGSMKVERLHIVNDTIERREPFAHDLADVVMSQLDRHILHARRTGGQV